MAVPLVRAWRRCLSCFTKHKYQRTIYQEETLCGFVYTFA